METLTVLVLGMVARLALLPLALTLMALPVVAVMLGARGAEMLWHRTVFTSIGGPLWRAT